MELRFEQWGDHGPALVCLHGLFGSASNWRTVAKRLAESFRVFAVDQRGHGGSPHARPLSYEALADDAQKFIAGQGIAPAHVVGHSMGGKVAMTLAMNDAASIARLIVVDIAPSTSSRDLRTIVDALSAIDPSACASRSDVDRRLAGGIPDVRVRQFLLTNLVRNDRGRLAWRIDLEAIDLSLPEIAGAIPSSSISATPALFIRGGESKAIRDEDVPMIERMFPASQLRTIEGAGHWVHADAPDPFVDLLVDFLSQRNGSG